MANRVISRKSFLRAAKKLAKRHRSFADDLADLIADLKENADIGAPLGHNTYKIRLGITSKGGGQRGGARVITYFYRLKGIVYLLFAYDKRDMDTIPETMLRSLVRELEDEIDAVLK